MSRVPGRTWGVRVGGEVLLSASGPDAEAMMRAVARGQGGVLIYRDQQRPTAGNGYELEGPWQEAE